MLSAYRFSLLLFCIGVILTNCSRPVPEPSLSIIIQWDKTFGGSDEDRPYSTIATGDGGFLLVGRSSSEQSGDKSEPSRGGGPGVTDGWVVKISANGIKQWDKSFGGNNGDLLYSVVATSDGGFLLGGRSSSGQSGDKSEPSRGEGDYWIVKINANGIKQWDKTFGGNGEDDLRSIVPTVDGGFLLGGNSSSDKSGDKSESSRDNGGGRSIDYWIVKVNADGNKQWDKTIGSNNHDQFTSMLATVDRGFLLAGFSYSGTSGDKSELGKGNYDYWIVKINADGIKQWDKAFGGDRDDHLRSVVMTEDGGFLLGGEAYSGQSGDKSVPTRGYSDSDYWIVKIDANGIKQWDKTFGGFASEQITFMLAIDNDGFVLGGESPSFSSTDKSESAKGRLDHWIIKIDKNGSKQWDKSIGGDDNDHLTSMISTTDSGYLLVGYSNSAQSGDKSEPSRGGFDYWTVKIK